MIKIKELLEYIKQNNISEDTELVFDNYYDNPNTGIEIDVVSYDNNTLRLSELHNNFSW